MSSVCISELNVKESVTQNDKRPLYTHHSHVISASSCSPLLQACELLEQRNRTLRREVFAFILDIRSHVSVFLFVVRLPSLLTTAPVCTLLYTTIEIQLNCICTLQVISSVSSYELL